MYVDLKLILSTHVIFLNSGLIIVALLKNEAQDKWAIVAIYYKNKLQKFINKNDYEILSDYMVAQYNSPWALPPFRKNEIIDSIK